jgi:hypothetical protein
MPTQRCYCRRASTTNKPRLLFCAGYTVWSGLRWAEPQPAECIAIVGIGGLGHLAVQYAKAAGFRTIAISHSTDKDKLILQLGADEIVRDGKGLAKIGGADVILGTSNSVDAMADSIAGLRPDGRLYGANPQGQVMYGADGHLSVIITRSDLPKFASNNRVAGTPEENTAIVQGSLAYFGTYSVSETDKTITTHVESSTFPNWNGVDRKTSFSISGDELSTHVVSGPLTSVGTGTAYLVWKRAK